MTQPLATLTFTPRAKGKIILLVDFNGTSSGTSDWGSTGNGRHRLWLTQNSVTTNGDWQPMSNTSRLKYTLQGLFNVEANLEVTCGLELGLSGLSSVTAYQVTIRAHLVKETSS